MPSEPCDAGQPLPLRITRQIDALCDEFEVALRQSGRIVFDPYLERVESAGRDVLVKELALLAIDGLRRQGAVDPLPQLVAANPGWHSIVEQMSQNPQPAPTLRHEHTLSLKKGSGLVIRCPHCHNTIDLIVDAPLVGIDCSICGGSFSLINDAERTRDATAMSKVAHFELLERLGMGEFGTVWKARDTVLDRTVALKIPRREQLDAASIDKFMREARAAAQLRHPNIVSTHEVGRHDDTLYIVSDYIRGVSLADMLADHRLGVRESVTIAAKMADALEHAHRSGVVHRDLKPSNILIDDRGEPHLMDFGLAKRKEIEITITTEGAILGTPAYMSPEQARGESSNVDGRSDVYSLGVILFQMLTGVLPFHGSTRMLLQKVINDDAPGPRTLDSHVPRDLDTVCLKCLEKEPSRRYLTASELAADLRRYLAGEPVAAHRLGRTGRVLRWARRNRIVAMLLAATIVTLFAATAISSYFAWEAAQSLKIAGARAVEVTDRYYDSLFSEIRLTREVRQQGYGVRVRELVDQIQKLGAKDVNKDELRRQLVLSMGDFVAYPPHVLPPFEEQVMVFRLGRDGRAIIVGLNNGRLLECDVENDATRREIAIFPVPVAAIALSEDEQRLLAADQSGMVRQWTRSGQDWKAGGSFQLETPSRVAAFLRNGELLAAAEDNAVQLWEVDGGKRSLTLPIDAGWSVRNFAFDVARNRLVAGYVDDRSYEVGWALWDLAIGERVHVETMPSLGNTYVYGAHFDATGDRMAIGFDEALLVYEMTEFKPTRLTGFDSTKAVVFSPTSPYLAAVNIRGWINVWNSTTNRHVATLKMVGAKLGRNNLAFSADGGRLVASQFNSIQTWDLTRASEKTVLAGHQGAIPCAVFRPDGELLATGGKDDQVRFWNPQNGQLVDSIGIGEAIQTLAFTKDGRILAVGSMGRADAPHLRLIDADSRKVLYEAAPTMGDVYSLAWAETTEGRYLAACGHQGVGLWKAPLGVPTNLEQVFEFQRPFCLATVIDPQARFMVWVEKERQLKAWDIPNSRELPLHAPEMQQGWHGLTLLPDGESIIYVSNAGVAEIWNVPTDRRLAAFGKPETFTAPHLAVSPNGKWFAALTAPDTVSVWDRPNGRHIFSLRPEPCTVWSLAWDPSNKNLAVGRSDGDLAIWRLPEIHEKLAEAGLPWEEFD